MTFFPTPSRSVAGPRSVFVRPCPNSRRAPAEARARTTNPLEDGRDYASARCRDFRRAKRRLRIQSPFQADQEPSGARHRAAFAYQSLMLRCCWRGCFKGEGAKKSPVFGYRLASGIVRQSCSIRFVASRIGPLVPVSCRVTLTTPAGL